MIMKSCATCDAPLMSRAENPIVYDTLNSIPINWCQCPDPEPVETLYSQSELRECYYLATEPTARRGGSVSIAISEKFLTELEWMVVQDDGPYLTQRGRKLFPLLLVVANELQN